MRKLFGLWVLAVAPMMACSGNVEDQRSGTSSGTSSAGSSGGAGPLTCGQMPTEGQIVTACIPMDGDYCLPAANSPGLLTELANSNGVCPETTPTACCGEAAYRQVVCDQPPGTSTCCYDVHYIEKVVCP
ncbi:MAG TPA: hypothetical protein PK156_20305 [Polyangium sp.]|nr:hypothetical protein [Polyangium sp.]